MNSGWPFMCQFSWLQLCTSPWQLPYPWFLDFRPPLSASSSSSKHWDGWDKRSIMSYAHCRDKTEEDLRDQVWEPWVIPALTSPSAPNLDPQNSPCPIHLKGSQHARQPNNAIISPSLFQHRCSASVCRARAHLGCTCGEGNKQTHNCWSWFWRWGWKGLFPWLNQRGSSIWAKPELE